MAPWKIYPLARTLGEHAPAWDALNQRRFNGHPMLGSRFVNGLLDHFGDGSESLCILTVDDTPQAMCLLKPRSPGMWATFLPAQTQICPVLSKNTTDLHDLMRALPGLVVRLDLLCVDPAFIVLPDTHNATVQITNHALTMAVSLDGGFENYRNSRSKKLVQNIGRYQRRLAADQLTRTFVQIDAPQDIGAAVARYAALESQGWKSKLGTAIKINGKQGLFYKDLLNRFALDGEARVFELWFADRMVASRLAIVLGQMIVMLKTTYNESYSQYSPGRLLLHDVIERLFTSHPDHVIEFYTDATPDQLSWAGSQRELFHLSAFRNQIAARLATARRRWRERKEPAVQVQPESAPGASSPSAPD